MPLCARSFCFPNGTYNNFFYDARRRKAGRRRMKEEVRDVIISKKLKSLHIFAGKSVIKRSMERIERRDCGMVYHKNKDYNMKEDLWLQFAFYWAPGEMGRGGKLYRKYKNKRQWQQNYETSGVRQRAGKNGKSESGLRITQFKLEFFKTIKSFFSSFGARFLCFIAPLLTSFPSSSHRVRVTLENLFHSILLSYDSIELHLRWSRRRRRQVSAPFVAIASPLQLMKICWKALVYFSKLLNVT